MKLTLERIEEMAKKLLLADLERDEYLALLDSARALLAEWEARHAD